MPRMFMTYIEVERALMDCGLRRKQARDRLIRGKECVAPHPHQMHSQRRWLRGAVELYCAAQRELAGVKE